MVYANAKVFNFHFPSFNDDEGCNVVISNFFNSIIYSHSIARIKVTLKSRQIGNYKVS